MDASTLFPKNFHPVVIDRAREDPGFHKARQLRRASQIRIVRYYHIDYSDSVSFSDGQTMIGSHVGQRDHSQPLHDTAHKPICDPFEIDIHMLGNVFRDTLCSVCAHGGTSLPNDSLTESSLALL